MGYIDADAHVIEPPILWDYMEPAERIYKPPAVTLDEGEAAGTHVWLLEGGLRWPFEGPNNGPRLSGVEQAARDLTDVPLRLRWMDRLGIEKQIVYPSMFLAALVDRPEVEAAMARAYNRFMADVYQQSNGRLLWAVVPSTGNFQRTIEDMQFGRKNGAVALYLRGAERKHVLDDPWFDPLYACAQDLDMAIGVHVGKITDLYRPQASFLVVPNLAAFLNIMLGDVHRRFPRLRFGFLESGSMWLPWAFQEIRRGGVTGHRRQAETSDSLLEERGVFVSCMVDDDLPMVLRETGPGAIVYGTDFDHGDRGTDLEGHRLLCERTDIAPEVARRIVDDNARRLYGLAA